MGLGCRIVHIARHDIEGDACLIAPVQSQNLAAVEIEEGLLGNGTDAVGALGSFVAETRTLSAGHEEHSNLACAQFLFAGCVGFGMRLRCELNHLRGDRVSKCSLCGLLRQHGLHAFDACKIKRGDLLEQGLLRHRIERSPEAKDVGLVVGL